MTFIPGIRFYINITFALFPNNLLLNVLFLATHSNTRISYTQNRDKNFL